ncbi:MAG: hypothetical protein U5K38_02995 [Woeseiaceae bacterium]|nr:hypothetical protein [Woeseiaceae bacterium]
MERLLALGKPLVLVLNKSDRHDAAEQALLMESGCWNTYRRWAATWPRDQVVAVSAGGEQELIERSADGSRDGAPPHARGGCRGTGVAMDPAVGSVTARRWTNGAPTGAAFQPSRGRKARRGGRALSCPTLATDHSHRDAQCRHRRDGCRQSRHRRELDPGLHWHDDDPCAVQALRRPTPRPRH